MADRGTGRSGSWLAEAEARLCESIERLIVAAGAGQADLVLIVPPFASPDRPSLGLHVIAGVAQAAGVSTSVVYGNLSFAQAIGTGFYRALCHTPTGDLVGEKLFRRAYYGHAAAKDDIAPSSWADVAKDCPPYADVQHVASLWSDAFAEAIARLDCRYVGATTVFEQTLASLTLLSRVKRSAPGKYTLLGGANTDGPMGAALRGVEPLVDYVFTGEAEASFAQFLAEIGAGRPPAGGVIFGKPNFDLNALDAPCYDSFFKQFEACAGGSKSPDGTDFSQIRLPYESSRGCWWGEKHHCTFCGLNANGMTHRIKNPEKVACEIHDLAARHQINRLLMVDNIMPHSYFTTLLPQLKKAERRLSMFYEQKANLSRRRMRGLKEAGIDHIQPGIESLSTDLLKLMNKGSSAQINIDCLRYARSEGVGIVWNLLCDFPGDEEDSYVDMLSLVPLLSHLQPPSDVGGLSIDRFSPYFNEPAAYGITDVQPIPAYRDIFPADNLHDLAYHFSGTYTSAVRRRPDLHAALVKQVDAWKADWMKSDPSLLTVFDLDAGQHLVVDTRPCATVNARLVDAREARLLLGGATDLGASVTYALDNLQLIEVDGRYGAIAFALPDFAQWPDEYQAA